MQGRDEPAIRAQEQQRLQTLLADEQLWVGLSSRLDSIERELPATGQH